MTRLRITRRKTRSAVALALAGVLALAATVPSYARSRHHHAAAAAGVAPGVALGAAVATPDYVGAPYDYAPDAYAAAPGYPGEPDSIYAPYGSETPAEISARMHGSGCPVEGAYRPDYSFC